MWRVPNSMQYPPMKKHLLGSTVHLRNIRVSQSVHVWLLVTEITPWYFIFVTAN